MPPDSEKPVPEKGDGARSDVDDAEDVDAAREAALRAKLDFKWYALSAAALVPAFAVGVYRGPRLLLTTAASFAGAAVVELAFSWVREKKVGISRSLVFTGLVFALVLPAGTPLWMVALGSAFGVLFGKEAFGGTGHNFFNPALVGKCFLVLSWPTAMAGAFGMAAAAGANAGGGGGVAALLLGPSYGGAGETCAAAVLVGGVFVLVMKVADWRTVVSAVLGAVIVAGLLALVRPAADATLGSALLPTVLSGSLLFAVLFLATDPVTSPRTRAGRLVHGALVGALAVLIAKLSNNATYTEAAMYAVLLGNLFAPAIDGVVLVVGLGKSGTSGTTGTSGGGTPAAAGD